VRVALLGHLRARISLHVDVNVGDPLVPPPGQVEVPRLLGGAITVRGYPLSMVFAEKIVMALQRGTVNTRWGDYADVAQLSAAHDVDGDELAASIDVVASHRNATLTPLDELWPVTPRLLRTSGCVSSQAATHRPPRSSVRHHPAGRLHVRRTCRLRRHRGVLRPGSAHLDVAVREPRQAGPDEHAGDEGLSRASLEIGGDGVEVGLGQGPGRAI
jgi:hypothetical protein